jgi:hypothetical protein
LLVDESITIGSEKLLLILGLPVDSWDFKRSLSVSDVVVLSVAIAGQWKAEQIQERLETIGKTHQISYVVCDNGNNLKRALKLSNLVHVPDCSYIKANGSAHQYSKNEHYLSLSVGAGLLRSKWYLSKKVVYMPPIQRTKARFQNRYPTIHWAIDILAAWEHIEPEIKAELAFVQQAKGVIEELHE